MPGAYAHHVAGHFTGKYRGWYELPLTNSKGKRPQRTKLFVSKTAAEDWARIEQAKVDAELTDAGVAVRRNVRHHDFAAFAATWHEGRLCAESTRKSRGSHVRALIIELAGLPLDGITHAKISAMVTGMKRRKLSGASIRYRVSTLSSMMEDAVADGLIMRNPVDHRIRKLLPPAVRRREPIRLRPDNFNSMLAIVPAHLYLPALIAFDCGLRAAEVAGLQWNRVDWEACTFDVTSVMEADRTLRHYPKGRRKRAVAIPPRTMAVLLARRGAAEEFIVANAEGHRFSPHALVSAWHHSMRRGRETTVPTFHGLRHSLVGNLYEAGADLRLIQGIAGHSSLATTQRYLPETDVQRQHAAMAQIGQPHLRAV